MNDELIAGLKKNWYLFVFCILLIGTGVVLGLRGEDEAEETLSSPPLVPGSDAARAVDERIAQPVRETSRREERALAAIDRYVKENAETGDGEAEEKNLYRIGNLYYASVLDYEKAALAYIELIAEYPKTDKLQMAYVALADCYHKLNDYDLEMETYRIIIQEFPSDSPAHQLASENLAGKRE